MFELGEYFAENEMIDIIPSQNINAIKLLSGTLGPFKLLQRQTVPLWVGLVMKQKHLCKIIPPAWLTVEALQDRCPQPLIKVWPPISTARLEKESQNKAFEEFEFYFIEISYMLLKHCEDDLQDVAKIKQLISDIRQQRGLLQCFDL